MRKHLILMERKNSLYRRNPPAEPGSRRGGLLPWLVRGVRGKRRAQEEKSSQSLVLLPTPADRTKFVIACAVILTPQTPVEDTM